MSTSTQRIENAIDLLCDEYMHADAVICTVPAPMPRKLQKNKMVRIEIIVTTEEPNDDIKYIHGKIKTLKP